MRLNMQWLLGLLVVGLGSGQHTSARAHQSLKYPQQQQQGRGQTRSRRQRLWMLLVGAGVRLQVAALWQQVVST
jgi:hypothetical protein